MSDNCLAMLTVPVQQWGELYQDQEALKTGTIFKELDKPFFATEEKKDLMQAKQSENPILQETEQERLLCKIDQVSFVLDDLTLYLDTHGSDPEARKLFRQKSEERKNYLLRFTKDFGSLNRDCLPGTEEEAWQPFEWQKAPIVWEGVCCE